MILTGKNAKDVILPCKVIFGEEWFVAPEKFGIKFFGVALDGKRPQPFPTPDAALTFAMSCFDMGFSKVEVIDPDGNVTKTFQ